MTLFSSKTPRDLNRDPFPFVTYRDETGSRAPKPMWRSECRVDGAGYYTKREGRAEYDHPQHNEPNPLILDYRLDIEHTTWSRRDPVEWLTEVVEEWPGIRHPFTDEQVEHARRVLARLAAFG